MHLLEDAGDRADEGGPEVGQVLDDLVDPPVHGRREPEAKLGRADHLPERVRQRQPEELEGVGVIEDARDLHRPRLRHPAAVGELDALGPAGGARGVEERGQRIRPHRRRGLLEAPRVRPIVGAALLLQLSEGGDPAVGRWRVPRRPPPCAGRAARSAAARRASGPARRCRRTRPLPRSRPGCRRTPRPWRRGRWRWCGAGAEDPEVGQDPLDPGGREDGADLLGRHAHRPQPSRDSADAGLGARPAQALPAAFDGVPERLRARGPPTRSRNRSGTVFEVASGTGGPPLGAGRTLDQRAPTLHRPVRAWTLPRPPDRRWPAPSPPSATFAFSSVMTDGDQA